MMAMPTTLKLPTTIETRCSMVIPNTKKRLISPTHPGVLLREEFMPDYTLTVSGLASALKVSRQSVNELLNGRRALTPIMALRLSRIFGNSPTFWMNAQLSLDLWNADQKYGKELKQMPMLKAA
jgi:addiction module HigA family antidote